MKVNIVSNKLYSFGSNAFGQLGLGDTENRNYPVQISIQPAIAKIRAGYSNTFFITWQGEVFGCGKNTRGGYATFTFIQMEILKNEKVREINVGY